MLKNYLKIAWRNLVKNKMYSLINLTGLTIGMTCFILIALFIQFETSFDKQHKKGERIYRVVQQQEGNEFRGTDYFAVTPRPLGVAMQKDFPEVEAVSNIETWGALLINENESFAEQGLYADKNLFDVFTIPVLEGVGKEALSEPNAILLTESLAKKIFGTAAVIGKTILYNSATTLTIKAVVADPPKNQHFDYSYIANINLQGNYEDDLTKWNSNNYYTYFVLAESYDYKNLEEKMAAYEEITKPVYEASGFQFYPQFKLQPLKDIHLKSNINIEIAANGDIQYIYFFAIIALIILVLAAINYMNLATAKSAQRAKEVGVSKVLGARKEHLIVQFLGESFILTLISFVSALFLVTLLLPAFNQILDKEIPFSIVGSWWGLIGMLGIALAIGVLSGLYPAIFLSGVSPVKALKGNFLKSHKDGALLRNSLVVGQFVVAIVLAVGSIIIHQQLDFIQNKKLGYNREQVVHAPYWEKEIHEKEDVIKAQLLSNPKIHKVSISTQLPMDLTSQGPVDTWEGNAHKEQLYIYRSYVDYEFIDLFEIELVEGRGFSKEFPTDFEEGYILNESALKKLGWTTAVGKKFNGGKVIGVVKDFHLQKFDLAIEPLYMTMRRDSWHRNHGEVIVKMDLDDYKETQTFIEETLKAVVPMAPYEAKFMEDSYAQLYDSETRLGKAFNIFSFLALFIAGMGLFGLVSFHVVQRTKEIGIRKVLGSSVSGIVTLLASDFLKLVVVALLIATPIAYYFMNNWLQDFAYSIAIKWWVFVIVGMAVAGIAFITISFQSIKAAVANPVKSLRTE